jgi:hypothetical protein
MWQATVPSEALVQQMHLAAASLRIDADRIGSALGRILEATAGVIDEAAFRGDTHGQAYRLAQIYLAGETYVTGPSYDD